MPWQLTDEQAILDSDGFVGSMDLKQLHLGCHVRAKREPLEIDSLFGFVVPDSPLETYVRGADLISRYPARSSDSVSYHTYHRALPESLGLEFILSAQTSRLHSQPLTQINSTFSLSDVVAQCHGQSIQVTSEFTDFDQADDLCFILLRPRKVEETSLVLFARPGDFHRAALARLSTSINIAFWVFPESLEKGVIRRVSLRLCLVPRRDDQQIADELVGAAFASGPSLST